MVSIDIASTASITGAAGHGRGLAVLRVGLRVLVLRSANAPASSIQVEGVGP
jgi:hypothetical protein